MITLSPYERKTLEILRDKGKINYPSAVGHLLLEAIPSENRKARPSQQGMALFAGKFLYRLRERGLIESYKGYSISRKGLELLITEEPA
ncbi:hypothetical protein [Massilia sp. CCM 8734]|uniref:hypothetical protein n=1 Tax=Massilia sp. CCM 8734 TaxID=2609283 RepID=UPI00141EFF0D|nr:hypothetical protein [Massilia sp. CCM 8734]NHZ94632.1 hypothetical protein [Massilia sp. CCM 8734]